MQTGMKCPVSSTPIPVALLVQAGERADPRQIQILDLPVMARLMSLPTSGVFDPLARPAVGR